MVLMQAFQNSNEWDDWINLRVRKMVAPLAAQNADTWRKAAEQITRGAMLHKVLQSEVKTYLAGTMQGLMTENAQLIKTLPTDLAEKVIKDVSKMTLEGMRSSAIQKKITGIMEKHANASAKLIARTEVSKTQSILTRARAEQLNVNWYVWRTEQDQRVRKSHRIMEGVLVRWNAPPSPEMLAGEPFVGNYNAGEIWNCRCYAEPLVELNDIRWPHKVYNNGTISSMTKKQFESLQ